MKQSPIRALAVIGAALVLMIGGAVAYAAIPDANGVIKGCYDSGGNLKVVEPGKPCPKGWQVLTWNQQGQSGVSGYERVTREFTTAFDTNRAIVQVTATCPSGKAVMAYSISDNYQNADQTPAGDTKVELTLLTDTDADQITDGVLVQFSRTPSGAFEAGKHHDAHIRMNCISVS